MDAMELRKQGERLPLQQQPFKILALLVQRAPSLVTREELRDALWEKDVFVDFEHSIHRSIRKLRETLEDSAEHPVFIQTEPRQGYRFIASVQEHGSDLREAESALGSKTQSSVAVRGATPTTQYFPRQKGVRRRYIGYAHAIKLAIGAAVLVLAVAVLLLAVGKKDVGARRAENHIDLSVGSPPGHPEANDLYFRSMAFPHDGPANLQAIQLLERAVGLDPVSAAAWYALAQRYRYHYVYLRGGPIEYEKAESAYKKALALDPDLVAAQTDLIAMRTERGGLDGAFDEAQGLLAGHPNSAPAHFAMSYVLRYAGLLSDSAEECNTAFKLDPNNSALRTCAQTFLRLGDYRRAVDFLRLDAGSDWAEGMSLLMGVRQGKSQEALRETKPIQGMAVPLLRGCLEGRPASEIGRLSSTEENFPVDDPEPRYHVATVDAFCGLQAPAMRLLRQAIAKNYCALPDLLQDPLLQNLRRDPAFESLRSKAAECQAHFLAHRERTIQKQYAGTSVVLSAASGQTP